MDTGIDLPTRPPDRAAVRGVVLPHLLRDETLVHIFRESVAREPGKLALSLIGTAEKLTYAELDERSDRVAAALAARGVRRGDFVGLWLKRSLDLHVALLGILKAGGAYIPFDAEAPAERVASCLVDCGARVIVSHRAMEQETGKLTAGEVAPLEDLLSAPALASGVAIEAAGPDDPAYAIYTSGSTGKPKGIVITHRNISHYLRSGNEALGFRSSDVVLQQASVAFDLSLEEIFVPYLVGATLKVASMQTVKETDRLPEIIEAEGITVIDTVPTLLSMFERDVPCLRIIVLGGEACPPALVERFARPGRFLFNTYGPTETTVVATYAELRPGEPVTIGRPIANYTAYVVDENMNLLEPGQTGELVVGGPGVAKGYINLPEMTAKKFVANPFDPASTLDPVLYRTGDAVSLDNQGRFLFLGRIDDQVKIRGYRIELGEIESLIAEEPGVRTAAVAVHQHPTAGETLVAHVVPTGDGFDIEAAKKALAAKVPPYMVPPVWQKHETLPRLASGKIDRKTLSALPIIAVVATGEQEPPRSKTEADLLDAAKAVFGLPVVPFEADFFTELGGHSLLAARFVSELRKKPALASIALQDMYALRTLRKLAAALDERAQAVKPDITFEPPPWRRRFLCGLAQLIALPFIIAIVTAQWMGLLLSSIYLVRDETPLWIEVITLCSIYVTLNMGAKVIVIALKWLVIGRTKPGVYPLWGAYYFRLWLMQRIVHLTAHKFLQGTPLMRVYLRALGAKVGRDAIINEFEEGAIDLIEFGPRASLGAKIKLANVEVIGGLVYVGRIHIGADAHIGNGCVIGHDTKLGEACELGDLTSIAPGTVVGDYERWDGSPGRKAGMVDKASLDEHPEASQKTRFWQGVGYFFAYNIIMMIGLLPIFPAFYVLYNLDNWTTGDYDYHVPWAMVPVYAWPAALALVFVSMGVAIVMRWVLLPDRVQPGQYSIFSSFYFRKWCLTLSSETLLETLNSLYATVFMRNWYRLMGCKLGRGTEISANFAGRYDLIEMGENNFIGDQCIFGDEDIHRGWMILKRLKTGDRVFFGNNAVVAQGANIESDSLIGVKSRLPDSLHVKEGETWFGSPAIQLPTRQRVVLSGNWTYEPPRHMTIGRTVFEAMHTSFPTAVLITIAYITADLIAIPIDRGQYGWALAIFMAAGVVNSFIMLGFSLFFKWVLMGVYKPIMKPMWSWWAMRTEAVAVFYGGLASKVLLEYLRGTPFLPWMLKPYGMKVGKGVYINSTDLTEFDCISIGDYSVINMQAEIQTHLYEDRVMKVGRIDIGRCVTICSGTTVLYDTKIEDNVIVGPLSLVMKGETLPTGTVWWGSPTQPQPVNPHATPNPAAIVRTKEPALAAE